MHPKRVLIVNVRSLLMESVAGLLESNGNGWFDVVSTLANNLPDLLHEIKETKPKVLIIDKTTSFIKPAELIVSLLYIPNIRLVVLDSQTSKMDIYDKSEFMIAQTSHFIEVLNHGLPSSL